MKSLNQYIVENRQTYTYRIKIAAELPDDFCKKLEKKLDQFDLVSLSTANKTPIQKKPLGFSNVENAEVHTMDAEFNYPASSAQIQSIITGMGIGDNCINIVSSDFVEPFDGASEEGPILTAELPEGDKQAGDEYNSADVKNADKSNIEYAAPNTPPAKTTNDLPQGTKSAMGSNKKAKLPDVKSFAR